jgi:hypothetical protein
MPIIHITFIILTFLTIGIFFANANTQTFVNPITEAFLDIANAPSTNDVMYWDGSKMAWTASSTWDTNTTYTGGTNLTLDGTTFNVDDAFIKNDGDVGTGVYDFGGATSFEIPNASSPTVDAAGEIAIDTTSDQFIFYGGAKRVLPYWQEKCFTVASTTFNFYDDIPLWYPVKAIEITNVYCRTDGGTSVVMTLSDGTNALESITCDANGEADDGSIVNGTFTARERLEVDFGTVTGAVNWLNACITYIITAD